MNSIEIYNNGEIELNISVNNDTTWLNKNEIAKLYIIDRSVVSRHIKNIFKNEELDKEVVCANFAHTTIHGAIDGKTQTKNIEYYNLDIILAVGYRTNSVKAISFRKWASNVLKDYIIDGYTINSNKITNDRFVSLENQVKQVSLKLDILENKNINPSQGIFYNGQIYDAYSFLNDLIKNAQKNIIIIDNYCDDTILTLLSKNTNIVVTIITSNISKQFKLDIDKYNSQYTNLNIIINKNYHDRFLIIDNEKAYHIGASLKDLGKKIFAFNEIDKKLLKIEELK